MQDKYQLRFVGLEHQNRTSFEFYIVGKSVGAETKAKRCCLCRRGFYHLIRLLGARLALNIFLRSHIQTIMRMKVANPWQRFQTGIGCRLAALKWPGQVTEAAFHDSVAALILPRGLGGKMLLSTDEYTLSRSLNISSLLPFIESSEVLRKAAGGVDAEVYGDGDGWLSFYISLMLGVCVIGYDTSEEASQRAAKNAGVLRTGTRHHVGDFFKCKTDKTRLIIADPLWTSTNVKFSASQSAFWSRVQILVEAGNTVAVRAPLSQLAIKLDNDKHALDYLPRRTKSYIEPRTCGNDHPMRLFIVSTS